MTRCVEFGEIVSASLFQCISPALACVSCLPIIAAVMYRKVLDADAVAVTYRKVLDAVAVTYRTMIDADAVA